MLVEQGYILKRYDSSYRLPPRPAVYSLAPKGITYLRNNNPNDGYSEAALRNMYKNKTASDSLVDDSLAIFAQYLQLETQYPQTFTILTKSEMIAPSRFVRRPLPALHLTHITTPDVSDANASPQPQEYVLDTFVPYTMTWLIRKRIRAHQDRAERAARKLACDYPTLLFICGNDSTERRVQKIVEDSYLDYQVWTATLQRFESQQPTIWRDHWDEEEMTLRTL